MGVGLMLPRGAGFDLKRVNEAGPALEPMWPHHDAALTQTKEDVMPRHPKNAAPDLPELLEMAAGLLPQADKEGLGNAHPDLTATAREDIEMWDRVPDLIHLMHVATEQAPDENYRLRYAALDAVLGLMNVARQLTRNWGVPKQEATRLVAHAMFPLLQELLIWATTQSLGTMREEGEA